MGNFFNKETFYLFLILFNVLFAYFRSSAQDKKPAWIIMDIPDYPTVFELDSGEKYQIIRQKNNNIIKRTIKLISVTPSFSPDFWTSKNGERRKIYTSAKVIVEINGVRDTLMHHPYQLPVKVQGLRIYVEGIKAWATSAEFESLKNMKKEVRFSVCAAGETWGPNTFIYPIDGYRFRSSSYNNTWASLVPYNLLYYHRGEDRGAIPDRLEVVSPISGKVIGTPIPDGDGASNGVIVQTKDSFYVRISHMSIENINPELIIGYQLKKSTLIGNTGMTWSGRRSQVLDPHCHINLGFQIDNEMILLSPYPYMIEAYFRKYSDSVLAVAGGYEFTIPNQYVSLDASRSVCRKDQHIESYSWILHDGTKREGANIKLKYKLPGLYTEELIVQTNEGAIDRDFLQVRVWDPEHGHDIAYGWVFQYPVRNVHINDPVMFWNRLRNTKKTGHDKFWRWVSFDKNE